VKKQPASQYSCGVADMLQCGAEEPPAALSARRRLCYGTIALPAGGAERGIELEKKKARQ
jgi:hypothetical protein